MKQKESIPAKLIENIKGLLPSREDLEARDEKAAASQRGTVPVNTLQERKRVSLYGVLRSVTYPPAQGNGSFVATLFDGTGSIDIVWLGRKEVPGVVPGAHMHVQGVVVRHRGTLCVMNPSYQIVTNEKA